MAGRHKKEIDYKAVYELSMIQCTDSEMAGVLGISRETLNKRKNDDPQFLDNYKKGKEEGKKSLRRVQWDKAINDKNVVMMIWLGKQYLNQSDKNEVDLSAEIKSWVDLARTHTENKKGSDGSQSVS